MPFSGKKLREWRLRRAITLRELGVQSGVAYDSINAIELGKQQPRPSTVRRLASALGVSPDVFFEDVENEEGKAAA
jgi:transcriptional regulator with XRE-family HTH domain